MAKRANRGKSRRTQESQRDALLFSDTEMDVARQLMELSGDSTPKNSCSDINSNNIDCGSKGEGKAEDMTDISSKRFEDIFEEEECWLFNTELKKWRTLDDLYDCTKLVSLKKNKKMASPKTKYKKR